MTRFKPEAFGIGRLFQRVSDAVVVADASTERIVLWNRAAGTLFGHDEDEALELPLHALVPEELRSRHRSGIARYQETGTGDLIRSGHPVELEGIHKDGHRIPIELSLTAIETDPGGPRYALAIIRDASERKVAEDARLQLREAEFRRKQALELHDSIVQGLAGAKMALELNDLGHVGSILEKTLKEAQATVRGLMADLHPQGVAPGDLVRESGRVAQLDVEDLGEDVPEDRQ